MMLAKLTQFPVGGNTSVVRLIDASPLKPSALIATTAEPSVWDGPRTSCPPESMKTRFVMTRELPDWSHKMRKSPGCRFAHGLQELISVVSAGLCGRTRSIPADVYTHVGDTAACWNS